MKEFKRATEIAKMFPIWDWRTYLKKARDGKITHTKIGSHYFFEPDEVKAYIDSITIKVPSNGRNH